MISDIGRNDLNNIYVNYFLHNDENNWRRGVFHYGLVIYYEDICGYMFRTNAYQIASTGMEDKLSTYPILDRDIVYGSAYMHELGHTFAFNPIPGHDEYSKYPWQSGYWTNRPYKSCMNYGWMYRLVDYSDGSRASPDIDDWSRIDYHSFENGMGIKKITISSLFFKKTFINKEHLTYIYKNKNLGDYNFMAKWSLFKKSKPENEYIATDETIEIITNEEEYKQDNKPLAEYKETLYTSTKSSKKTKSNTTSSTEQRYWRDVDSIEKKVDKLHITPCSKTYNRSR